MTLRQISCESGRWIELAQDQVSWQVSGVGFWGSAGSCRTVTVTIIAAIILIPTERNPKDRVPGILFIVVQLCKVPFMSYGIIKSSRGCLDACVSSEKYLLSSDGRSFAIPALCVLCVASISHCFMCVGMRHLTWLILMICHRWYPLRTSSDGKNEWRVEHLPETIQVLTCGVIGGVSGPERSIEVGSPASSRSQHPEVPVCGTG